MPDPRPRRDYAPEVKSTLKSAFVLALLGAAAYWSWHQPFMARPRMLWELSRMPPPVAVSMPVDGVSIGQVADTYGAPRGSDRSHEGVDIFAPRGTPVLSATRGVVSSLREGGLGGRQVWVYGPSGQRHYYAHLDAWEPGLAEGDVVLEGSVLGFVGDTGNARGTPPHLHYGIYGPGGAIDPLPLLRAATGGDAAPPDAVP